MAPESAAEALRQKRGLVVGGIVDFVSRSVDPALAKFGIEREWHWSMDRLGSSRMNSIPSGCEVVIALFEMIPNAHGGVESLKRQARDRGIPCVVTSRKKSVMWKDLARLGFVPLSDALLAEGAEGVESMQVVTKVEQPAVKKPSTYEEAVARLAEAVKALVKDHGVSQIQYLEGIGIEITRKLVDSRSIE